MYNENVKDVASEDLGTQVTSQAVSIDDVVDQLNQTDDKLAQRSSSMTSDDILYDGDVSDGKDSKDILSCEDQDVLLELNTEEQEQFEVLDSADGGDDRSESPLTKIQSTGRCGFILIRFNIENQFL